MVSTPRKVSYSEKFPDGGGGCLAANESRTCRRPTEPAVAIAPRAPANAGQAGPAAAQAAGRFGIGRGLRLVSLEDDCHSQHSAVLNHVSVADSCNVDEWCKAHGPDVFQGQQRVRAKIQSQANDQLLVELEF